MGKQFLTITVIIAATIFEVSIVNAQSMVNINFDAKTLEWLTANTATQETTNLLHNVQVDSIKKKQTRLMEFVTSIAVEKEMLAMTYKNVVGFKKESKYYKAMVAVGTDIVNHSASALSIVKQSKLPGKAIATIKISDLVAQAISLGKVFADIVANSEVDNPVNHPDATSGDKDKHNLLNRKERLQMANDILFRLKGIDHQLCYLIYLTKHAEWRDVLFHLDRKTFLNYITAHREINEIVNKWGRIEKQ